MNAEKLAVAIGLLKDKSHSPGGVAMMRVPITEIDGVKNINCEINFYQKGKGICFEVTADFKYNDDDSENPRMYSKTKYNETGINKDDILLFSRELLDELPHLRLGLCGDLLIRDTEYLSMRAAIEDVFASIECETVKVEKTQVCSVCYEKTDTMTPCRHPLCNRCWSKIDRGVNGFDSVCPLCRKEIYCI